jgi:hypothetical protein
LIQLGDFRSPAASLDREGHPCATHKADRKLCEFLLLNSFIFKSLKGSQDESKKVRSFLPSWLEENDEMSTFAARVAYSAVLIQK